MMFTNLKKSIIIYGTGPIAGNIVPAIFPDKLEIVCFIDERTKKIGSTYCDKPVLGLEALQIKEYDYVLIASRTANKIKKRLQKDYQISAQKLIPFDFEDFYRAIPPPRQETSISLDIQISDALRRILLNYPGVFEGLDLEKMLTSPILQQARRIITLGWPLIFLETTPICNMHCPFCPYPVLKRSKQKQDIDRAFKFLDGLYDYGYRGLTVELYLLGEPLLNNEIYDYINKVVSLGYTPNIVSNGILANADIARQLYDAGLRNIQFSVQAPDSDCYKMRDTKITYEENLRRIFEFLFQWYLLDGEASIYIMTTGYLKSLKNKLPLIFDYYNDVSEFNYKMALFFEHIDKFLQKCFQHSPSVFIKKLADSVEDYQLAVSTNKLSFDRNQFNSTENRLSGIVLSPGLTLIKQSSMLWAKQKHFVANFLNIPEDILILKENYEHSPCLLNQIGLLSNGEVVGCCLDFEGETSFGNINDKSISEILDSVLYKNFKQDCSIFPACRRCHGELEILD